MSEATAVLFRVTTVELDGVEREDSQHTNAREAFRRAEQLRRKHDRSRMVVMVRNDDDPEHDPSPDDYCPACGAFWPPHLEDACVGCGLMIDAAVVNWTQLLYENLDGNVRAPIRFPGVVFELPDAWYADDVTTHDAAAKASLVDAAAALLRAHLSARAGVSPGDVDREVDAYREQAGAGDYGHALAVTMLWIEVR